MSTSNSQLKEQAQNQASQQVVLQVGDRRFVTSRDTLTTESGYFAALLSGRWNDAREDGSYLIDADPYLFEHILQYLRQGVPPLFFDSAKGHDRLMYLALYTEARYFQN
ncbi:Uncharacterized protein PECH_008441 [Penicillium ucsense]|uniref:BTB domain-containing protein n=1 Tax=Penicillium ucsense TaxID=2839758 RepID=A0A8J8W6G9_9EURO|nr:Uncharacterized protein PECM_003687 [Penicillium ucsense]KAF7734128.1 Uncharacterized protein PECH_008441 [Penicillium ucsense]